MCCSFYLNVSAQAVELRRNMSVQGGFAKERRTGHLLPRKAADQRATINSCIPHVYLSSSPTWYPDRANTHKNAVNMPGLSNAFALLSVDDSDTQAGDSDDENEGQGGSGAATASSVVPDSNKASNTSTAGGKKRFLPLPLDDSDTSVPTSWADEVEEEEEERRAQQAVNKMPEETDEGGDWVPVEAVKKKPATGLSSTPWRLSSRPSTSVPRSQTFTAGSNQGKGTTRRWERFDIRPLNLTDRRILGQFRTLSSGHDHFSQDTQDAITDETSRIELTRNLRAIGKRLDRERSHFAPTCYKYAVPRGCQLRPLQECPKEVDVLKELCGRFLSSAKMGEAPYEANKGLPLDLSDTGITLYHSILHELTGGGLPDGAAVEKLWTTEDFSSSLLPVTASEPMSCETIGAIAPVVGRFHSLLSEALRVGAERRSGGAGADWRRR